MILFQIILGLFGVFPNSLCLKDVSIDFSVSYYIHRSVKIVCVLDAPEDYLWSHEFAKEAFSRSISVAKVVIDGIRADSALSDCLSRAHSSIGVFIRATLAGFQEILHLASKHNLFDSNHIWLIIDENSNMVKNSTDLMIEADNLNDFNEDGLKESNVFDELILSVDADVHIAKQVNANSYDLYEVFNFGKIQGGKIVTSKVAYWDQNTGFTSEFNKYKIYSRWDFKQLPIRLIVVFTPPPINFDPQMIIGEQSTPGVAAITKTSTTVLHTIAEIHNIRFKYTLTDRWIGGYNKNSSRVAANSLYFGEQDITPVLRASKAIAEKLDLIYPALTSIETRYYYRIPTSGPGRLENQFFRPLTTGAWYCVLLVTSLCGLVLLMAAKLERRPTAGQYAFFSVVASFCQQFYDDSGDKKIRRESFARRLAILVTGISCLLIYNYYTSSVVSWLLNGPPPSINSLQELLESPLQLIYEDIGYTRSWLQSPDYYFDKRNAKMEDDMRQKKVFSKKKSDPLLVDLEEGIEMVKAGGFAYHTEVNSANLFISRKFTQSELCELGSLQSMEKSILMPGVQKNSPYREFFVWSILRLTERGVVSCIQQRTSSVSVRCEGSSPRALALGGAAPAFILLALGYLLAIGILVIERLSKKSTGKK